MKFDRQLKHIRREATFLERMERMALVWEQYGQLKEELMDCYGLSAKDGRVAVVRNIRSHLRTVIVMLRWLDECSESEQFARHYLLLDDVGNRAAHIRSMNKFLKLSYCVQFQFQVETLLKTLLKELGYVPPGGYYRVCEKIVNVLGITNGAYRLKVLNLLAYIRNSQHANGPHFGGSRGDTIIQVQGVRFAFRHGKVVRCANWDHIALASVAVLNIVQAICATLQVRGTPDPIPDIYIF